MNTYIRLIERLVRQGGPKLADYPALTRALDAIAHTKEGFDNIDIKRLRAAFGDALTPATLQGHAFTKPYGYAGDFEMLDKIYTRAVSSDPRLRAWDEFFHAQQAPKAVRNRKAYFKDVLVALLQRPSANPTRAVLNLASGPGRDVFEFFQEKHDAPIEIDCVDHDPGAIDYAKILCAPCEQHVHFIRANALKYRTDKKYDLIWSAGLFDYFDDKAFVFVLTHLLGMLDEQAELVVGNFSGDNPSRHYMELIGEWHLHHRSAGDLIRLAQRAGAARSDIRVGKEPTGVNLFLHIKRGDQFIGHRNTWTSREPTLAAVA